MKKVLFFSVLSFLSAQVFCQSAVGVPQAADCFFCDVWANTDPSRVATIDGKFIESKSLRGKNAILYFRNYGFNIPSNATINGIDVRVTRKKKGSNEVKDVTVSLLKPINSTEGMGNGPNLANPTPWTEMLTTVLYPFPKTAVDADGNTFQWTPADVNSSGFGLHFNTNVGVGKGAYILFDKVELTVNYTQGTTVKTQSRTGEIFSRIALKQLGNRFEVKTAKEVKYLFTVRDRNGNVLQQTSFIGGRTSVLTLDSKCRGYCIVTVEGDNTASSLQAYIR